MIKINRKPAPKNWYSDRYISLVVQRNLLFALAIMSSVGVLIGLVIIKAIYEQRSIDPYLIEVEQQSNIITTVDQESKAEYTARESIKEYFIVNYIKARESYDSANYDANVDLMRIFSSKQEYEAFASGADNARLDAKNLGYGAVTVMKLHSIAYLTPNRAKIRFVRESRIPGSKNASSRSFSLIFGFAFLDLRLSMEDLHINPLGFQVNSYIMQEEKIFDRSQEVQLSTER